MGDPWLASLCGNAEALSEKRAEAMIASVRLNCGHIENPAPGFSRDNTYLKHIASSTSGCGTLSLCAPKDAMAQQLPTETKELNYEIDFL